MENIKIDCLIIGAGVAGLAVAKKLSISYPDTFIIEKNKYIGEEVSSRNSEVIHAGIYYKKNSLKHKLVSESRDSLYKYLQERRIPFSKCGKFIVSSSTNETNKLNLILENAKDCGVSDIYFDTNNFKQQYPFIEVDEALFSNSTGIFDSHKYMENLKADFEVNGGHVLLNNTFSFIDFRNGYIEIQVTDNNSGNNFKIKTQLVINCAGLYSADIHNLVFEKDKPFLSRYVKGEYYIYSGKETFEHLIYPIPGPDSLGIHITKDLGGQIKFGPSAYDINELNYEVNLDKKDSFIKNIREYWPSIDPNLLQPSYSGIRPKLEQFDDFQVIRKDLNGACFVSVMGYESPGLTSSLGLADYIYRLVNE